MTALCCSGWASCLCAVSSLAAWKHALHSSQRNGLILVEDGALAVALLLLSSSLRSRPFVRHSFSSVRSRRWRSSSP